MNILDSIKETYCVRVFCDDYLANEYRLRVFQTFNEAKNFIQKTFFNENLEPIFFKRDDFSYYVSNFKSDDYEILSQDSKDYFTKLNLNVREIYIEKLKNFILLPNSELIELKLGFTNEIVSENY